jgi:hypothetical protein
METRLKRISPEEYDAMVSDATVLQTDHFGPKVFALSDGSILKLFTPRPLLSSATLYPYAKRFARNAQKLRVRRVPTVEMIDIALITHRKLHCVRYRPLPGRTLRSLGKEDAGLPKDLVRRFAAFVAGLHEQGVYFRSFHLGNVIVTDDGRFGLIDIADLWTRSRPLTRKQRIRNISRIYRFADEIEMLRAHGATLFIESYIENAGISPDDPIRETLQLQQEALLKTQRTNHD